MNNNRIKLLSFFALVILLPQCGKKRRNFYVYEQEDSSLKINKLSLPAIKEIKLNKTAEGNHISWTSPKQKHKLLGYNIYRFRKGKFIRKKPFLKTSIKKTAFIDKVKSNTRWCYLVRGIFEVQKQVVEGPTSKIVCS